MNAKKLPKVLCIGGSDPSGGGGIQIDSRVLIELKTHPLTAITALTAQNSFTVYDIFTPSHDSLKSQLEAVFADFEVNAVKIGMLSNFENVMVVSKQLQKNKCPFVILDPVFRAKSGMNLLTESGFLALKDELLPLSSFVTPNIEEAEKLINNKIETKDDIKEACQSILKMGPKSVIIKGGHLKGKEAIDVLFDGKDFEVLSSEKIDKKVRGTGCIFSSSLAAYLAQGHNPKTSFKKAKEYALNKIKKAIKLGHDYYQIS